MVDSRAKGARAELKIRDDLRTLTGHKWERVPASGGLAAVHGLKGDLYIPNANNYYCVEVKHYADDHLSSKLLTDSKPQFEVWWEQTLRESAQISKEPMLIFKHDRSKIFCAVEDTLISPTILNCRFLYLGHLNAYILRLEDFVQKCGPKFII